MPYRPCLRCKRLMPLRKGRSTCPSCTPTARERGYDAEWSRLSRIVIMNAGECERCHHRGSPANPLTADHRVSKADGGSDDLGNLRCLCRRCNGAKGGNSE